MDLAGRTILVTGASGGLGQAIARALAARGGSVVATGRRADVLEPLAADIGGQAVACDLADAAAVDRLLDEFADVDALVANAGLPASGPIESFTVEAIDRALAVDPTAPLVIAPPLSP